MKHYRKRKLFREKLIKIGKFIGIILIISGISWLSIETKKFLKSDSLFQIEGISVEQNSLLDYPEVQKILDSNYNLNIFGLKLLSLKKKLAEIPQLENVVVKRRFPNIVQIKIEEREPVLLLKWENTFYGVDDEGCIFPQLKGKFRWDLPVITGLDNRDIEIFPGSSSESLPEIFLALEINKYFKDSNMNLTLALSEAHFEKFDEIFLYTSNPRLVLRFLENNLEKGFENLSLVLADLDEKVNEIEAIDLRFQEKVFVHLEG